MRDLAYLKLLARDYPSVKAASSEIINLMAISGLPKGTEYFFSDLHGEYEAFIHLLRSASGIIREKIRDTFGHIIPEAEQVELANLIYYPERNLARLTHNDGNTEDWQRITIYRLVRICKEVSSKYTRSKVRKKMPKEFAYIIDELLHVDYSDENKRVYYEEIIHTVIDTQVADAFIAALCVLIQNLTIDSLHIIGDIFDRGPRADIIMDELMRFHDVDIQWGNHDISWMGAATGNEACVCNVLRIAISYNSFDVLEDGYGINLRPLSMFAARVYKDDPCSRFTPKILDENIYDVVDPGLVAKMHKAIAMIQFKLEGQLIHRRPEFQMEHRLLLDKMDLEKGTVEVEGKTYPLKDTSFPTFDKEHPYQLSPEEAEVVERLVTAFVNCGKLQEHVRFLYTKGSLYKVYNGNLLYHGCVPFNEDGSFKKVRVFGQAYSGRELYDVLENYARKGYYSIDPEEKQKGLDILWFIWKNANSPVFGKSKMTTFERYFIADKETHKEPKNPYYRLLEQEEIVNKILEEFGLSQQEDAHIINGHVPVETKRGESPVKCGGKLLIIDGGFSKAYQSKTGIAGYTLIYNSYGLLLAAHEPFESVEKAVQDGSDIHSHMMLVHHSNRRITVSDTDIGEEIRENIEDLEKLLRAYREGTIVERQ